MKAGAFLDALRALPLATPLVFTGGGPLVVLSPHPDDESLGLGGTIAAAVLAGQDVRVIVLTDGAGSHPHSKLYPAERLVAVRKSEAAAAVAALGLPANHLTHLDLPDTRAPTEGVAFADAIDRIAAVVESAGASTLLTTWKGDPHCDHEAAALMGLAVRARLPRVALWAYPIWGWHLDPDAPLDEPEPTGFRLDIEPWLDRKRAAIAAHDSQMTDLIPDDPEGFRFTPQTLAPFLRPVETVFAVPR